MQVLQASNKNVFFPSITEEIIVVNPDTKAVLNYLAMMEVPEFSLIHMLEGPTASRNRADVDAEEGYHSQEIFTQEKYFYLFYQGLRMLEFFYRNGITHGHINATNLKIKDDYTLCIGDFSISTITSAFNQASEQIQDIAKTHIRAINTETMSHPLQTKIMKEVKLENDNMGLKLGYCEDFSIRELMQEDWKDLIASFFFAKMHQVITDDRIRSFLE